MLLTPSIQEHIDAIQQDLQDHGALIAQESLRQLEKEIKTPSAEDLDKILNIRIQILINLGHFEDLQKLIKNQVGLSKTTQARILLSHGIIANQASDHRRSLTFFLEAESLIKELDESHLKALIQINIGTVYASLHHYKEGLNRYNIVLDKFSDVLTHHTKSILLHNLGNLYYSLKQFDQSIDCLEASIRISSKTENASLHDKSKVLLWRSKLAIGLAIKAVEINLDSAHDLYPALRYCHGLSQKNTKPEEWEEIIQLASKKKDFGVQLDALRVLIHVYKSNGDYKSAYQALETNRAIEKELLSIQQSAKLTEQEVRFEILEKERAIKTLEKEKELQQEIVKRNEKLEAANEELQQFAYVVSHDLKEPLRMIGAYTQLIESNFLEQIKPEEKEYFEFVSGGVKRLNILLDGLSNYATLKSLQKKQTIVELSGIIRLASENLAVIIQETNTKINLINDITFSGSTTLLTLLFQNLIQNSIKFTKEGKRPIIHINGYSSDGEIIIDLEDNGIGIAKNQSERVFVIFQKLNRNNMGSGMGLAICKKIVQLHNGKIKIANSNNDGTIFRITLPHKTKTASVN